MPARTTLFVPGAKSDLVYDGTAGRAGREREVRDKDWAGLGRAGAHGGGACYCP